MGCATALGSPAGLCAVCCVQCWLRRSLHMWQDSRAEHLHPAAAVAAFCVLLSGAEQGQSTLQETFNSCVTAAALSLDGMRHGQLRRLLPNSLIWAPSAACQAALQPLTLQARLLVQQLNWLAQTQG